MRAVDLIARKRDGDTLDLDELRFMVGGYLEGAVSEGQLAALLMAGVLRGFAESEARALTTVLVESGEELDVSRLRGPTVDKHSTGGVADTTTLLVAPLLAAAGAQVVKLSGRGLGHTGGTLDKLEAIPGLRVDLSADALLKVAEDVGCVVAAQTAELVPADKALYALRDVTATVASPALIASSVMSKKLAAGAETIVLDVKCGDGAFMATEADAVELATLCVAIGRGQRRRCGALVTRMDQPLGTAVGNALEVVAAVELLSTAPSGRLAELALDLAAQALSLAQDGDAPRAREELAHRWAAGEALDRLQAMVAAQGGDAGVCERPREVLPAAPVVQAVTCDAAGVVHAVPARAVGELAVGLGAGRASKDDDVDPAVGVELRVEVGDPVTPGTVLGVVHARSQAAGDDAARRLRELVAIAEHPVDVSQTLVRTIV